jgi:hypothetical protein
MKARDKFAGKKAKCPRCGATVTVPAAPPSGEAAGDEQGAESPPPQTQPANEFDFDSSDEDDEGKRKARRPRRNRGLGIAALVLGILSFASCPCFGLIAVLLAAQALRDDHGDGCARAGMILGWISTAFFVVLGVIYLALLYQMLSSPPARVPH